MAGQRQTREVSLRRQNLLADTAVALLPEQLTTWSNKATSERPSSLRKWLQQICEGVARYEVRYGRPCLVVLWYGRGEARAQQSRSRRGRRA
eukprot:6189621-Pleurochrysis_carterae.AAC.2